MLGRERNRIREVILVARHRGVVLDRRDAAAIDLVELRIGERAGDLAHPVGAEVERDD